MLCDDNLGWWGTPATNATFVHLGSLIDAKDEPALIIMNQLFTIRKKCEYFRIINSNQPLTVGKINIRQMVETIENHYWIHCDWFINHQKSQPWTTINEPFTLFLNLSPPITMTKTLGGRFTAVTIKLKPRILHRHTAPRHGQRSWEGQLQSTAKHEGHRDGWMDGPGWMDG